MKNAIKTIGLASMLILSACTGGSSPEKPLIGISTGYSSSGTMTVGNTYVQSVINAGGIPYILPMTHDSSIAENIMDMLDGLVLTGGEDIHPAYYGEEIIEGADVDVNGPRDTSDVLFASLAFSRNMPVLAICRGEQLANVVLGGSLYQDIPSQCPDALVHSQSEPRTVPSQTVSFVRGSYISELLGVDTLAVNSFHHQSVKEPAPGLKVVGRTSDGSIEAYEGLPEINIVATQFHPEPFAMNNDPTCLKFFQDLSDRALKYRKTKNKN